MITFDVLTLSAFINEQQDNLTDARINKIQQPSRREFVFTLRKNSETRFLYININPAFYHVCFTNKLNLAKRVIENPKNPPMFCMLLRKYLENSKISKINQPENERILELYIETFNEIGDKIYLCLAVELMGKHSNVILYNTDTGLILGCAHNVGVAKSREREVYGGIPYVYPPKQNSSDAVWKTLIDEKDDEFSVNDFIDSYYTNFIAIDKFKNLKSIYRNTITQKVKKVNKSLKQMEYKLQTDSDSGKYRLWGDLIMANLYQLKDFSTSVEVYDYENDKQITLKLNPEKTLKENANNFYRLYNKAKTAIAKLTALVDDAIAKKEYFEQILYFIDSAQSIEDLLELSGEIIENNSPQKNIKKQIEVMKIDLEDGDRIYIGKNNKQNDYIISKLANDEDLWFHVHNSAGSHVLLKSQKITDELILRCARLAKDFSTMKNSAKAGVIYTKRKYIRKPPGANLGYVTYRNEQEIIV